MTTPRILLDCDPGIDDALALIYLAALHHAGEIELVGVTTTAGNIDVDTTARNAAFILRECGLGEIPVAPGHPVPLEVPLVTTPETHGPAGLGYVTAPDWHSDYNWRDLWDNAAEQGAQLIVTGPLTNAALAGVSKFSQVTVMGGAVNYRGNTHSRVEFLGRPACRKAGFCRLARKRTPSDAVLTGSHRAVPHRATALGATHRGAWRASGGPSPARDPALLFRVPSRARGGLPGSNP